MADISARINDLEAGIERARWHLEPHVMQNFPIELLRAVFLELADEIHRAWTWDDKMILEYIAPKTAVSFVLAAVCSRWRQLALETGSLWSFIAVPPPSSEEDAVKALAYTRTLVTRSGISPIDGCITWPRLKWESMPDPCYSIIGVLASVAPRWRRISVDLPGDTDVDVFDFFRRRTPLLEEISVWYRTPHFRQHPYNADPDIPRYLPFCPSLRRFRASRCNIIFSAQPHSFAHLTHIQIWSDLSASAVWEILHLVPAVKHLDLWLQSRLGTLAPSPGFQLHLPALEQLLCCHFAINLFDHWASFLETPSLHYLELELAYDDEDDNAPTIENLIRRTASSVVSLKITDISGRMATSRAAEMLLLRNLRVVDLHAWFEPSFFERLVDARAWPLLEAMNIDPSDNEDFTAVAGSILKFVRSRTVDIDSLPPNGDPVQLTRLKSFSIVQSYIPEWLSEQIAPYMSSQ
ncbi:hypothetical protein AURDEDRAFT_171658 [Auricularia subglabra TFB-10046 SS5]|nr:hypothetical protein AURDEDRAFT_171658 [Auricularia subglabra TFB-10046 SS5]